MDTRRWAAVAWLAASCGLLAPAIAWAFLFPNSARVVEYKHLGIDHYFITGSVAEQAAMDAGAAGPGWVRTGYTFGAWEYPKNPGAVKVRSKPVARFHGTPGIGPNSHFLTADETEAEGLKGSGTGWTYEGIAFEIDTPRPDGTCAYGSSPVHRFYNNRWQFNDSNHRYVVDEAERARMVAAGWSDEGPVFCTSFAGIVPFARFLVDIPLPSRILPASQCADEQFNVGGCLAIANLPLPNHVLEPLSEAQQQAFESMTSHRTTNEVFVPADTSMNSALQRVFVQSGPITIRGASEWGIHVETRERGASPYSGVAPHYQFRTAVTPGMPDARFFPWRGEYPTETELALKAALRVRFVRPAGPGDHTYGHPTLEFVDQRSGRHLRFSILAYGTQQGTDFVAPDVATRTIIVGTTLRTGPYGRSLGSSTYWLSDPRAFEFVSISADFRMSRTEFQAVLAAARTAESALSPDPHDYLVHSFRFNNEVIGHGAIGLSLGPLELSLATR